MRCTRCDRLAVPQALGTTPDGRLVFGWCLDCLTETNCTGIQPADDARGIGLDHGLRPLAPVPDRGDSVPDRRQAARLVVGLLGGWALVLSTTGVFLIGRARPAGPSPLGNGTPIFLLAGGASSAVTCGLLWGLMLGPRHVQSWKVLRALRWATFLLALIILMWGIIVYTPRRAPLIVAAAASFLGLSAMARVRERRLRHKAAVCRPDLD